MEFAGSAPAAADAVGAVAPSGPVGTGGARSAGASTGSLSVPAGRVTISATGSPRRRIPRRPACRTHSQRGGPGHGRLGVRVTAGGGFGRRCLGRSAARSTDATAVAADHSAHSGPTGAGAAPDKLKRVLAGLSEKPESVQHWHTDKANLEELLDRLAAKPGVHAVHLSNRRTRKWLA